jgi:hypothetical protein
MNTINQEKKEKRKHIIEQEKWREKQLKLFYYSGRPIMNTFIEKKYMFYMNKKGYVKGFYI